MNDTSTREYTLRIMPAGPDDEGNDDGLKYAAELDDNPLRGYGETAAEAAAEVISAYV